jgi:hypothetical protein
MNKLKLWIGIILVFILGALIGSLGMGIYIQKRFEQAVFDGPRPGSPPHPPMMRFLMKRLDRELDLTKTQKNDIEKIMKQTLEDVHVIMQKQHPELEKLVEENFGLMKEKLHPEQKEKLENLKLFERMKKRMHRRHRFHPGIAGETPDKIFSRLKERLKLSETQAEKVSPIIEESIEKRLKILETYREAAQRDKRAMKNEMGELQESIEKQLKEILTEEQMDLYCEIQEGRRMHLKGGMRH